MADIKLGNWEPDRAGISTGLLSIASNAYPSTIGWGPMPSLTSYGASALPSTCKGLFFARTSAGAYQVFCGTATKLYKLIAGVWTDYTRSSGGNYSVGTDATWRAAQWDSLLIVVNGTDEPQYIDVDNGSSVNFAPLAGDPPVASDISIVGDFVFLVDATDKKRIIHCGRDGPNSTDSWTVGTALCDEYIAVDGGQITSAPSLGEYGIFLQDGGIARRLQFLRGDPDNAFAYDKIEGVRGSLGPQCVTAANGKLYYLSEDGFYTLDANGVNEPIGAHRIDKWFKANTDQARVYQTLAFNDPYSTRVFWAAYRNSASTAYDLLLGFDWQLDRWFYSNDVPATYFAPVALPAVTLESLDTDYPVLDDMTFSLDSRELQGGRPTLAGVTAAGALAFLSGPNLSATFVTAPAILVEGSRAYVPQVEPVGEWNTTTPTLRIGTRERTGEAVVWSDWRTPNTENGIIYTRVSGRYFTFELTTTAGTEWDFAQILTTMEIPDGER